MLDQTPTEYVPEWLKYVLTLLLGGGAVRWLSVYLESKRLANKDFRETLLERIRELEKTVAKLQDSMATVRVENAVLDAENQHLKKLLRRASGTDEDAHP